MNHDTSSKMDLLNSKCDDVIGSMRIKTPLAYKGYTAYASFHPPPSDLDSTSENTFTYDQQYWLPIPSTARLDRQIVMTKHHFVAEPDWLPPVQTVQHRVPRPHSRGVKLRSVEAIVSDNQRQKAAAAAALANEEKGQHATIKMQPRQQATPRQPPAPKSKVLDILDEIKAVSRNSSSNSSTPNKFGLTPTTTTPTQNGNMKKQQSSIPSKRPSDNLNRQTLKKRTQSTPQASTPRSRPLTTEKTPSKTLDVVTKSRPKSSDTNLDLFMTKQFLINDLNDPAANRHLEDLSSLNVIRKRPVLRIHLKIKLPKIKSESRSTKVITKPKNDTQASPVVTGDAFNLPTGTIPTEFIRSMKIRKKSKSDPAATPSSPPASKSGRSHTIELEEGETISPSPSPRRRPSLSPERNTTKSSSKRHRDNNGVDDHEQQKLQSRRSKISRKDVSVPLSSSSSASSSTSTTSRNITAHDNPDDRQRHDSPTTTSSKSLVRKDREEERRPSSKRMERTTSTDDDRRRSKYTSSSRHSRDDESRHRSSQRSSGSRQRRSVSKSRSPSRRSSSTSSHTRSTSQDKHRRPTVGSSSSSSSSSKDKVLNGPLTPKDSRKESAPTPTGIFLSPAIQAIKKEPKESSSSPIKKEVVSSPMARKDPIPAIKKESKQSPTIKPTKNYPPATAEDAETRDQCRIFNTMFVKLAVTYKRRGDQQDIGLHVILDHMHATMNWVLGFYYQDKLNNLPGDSGWASLPPFILGILGRLSKLRKERYYYTLYGLCLRMSALIWFHIFKRREPQALPTVNRLCAEEDENKRMDYGHSLTKTLTDYESALGALRESERYVSYDLIQQKFPQSFENVCVRGQVGPGIVLGGEAGVSVGPMFPLVPFARLNHAAIMVKCLLQEFVDNQGIDYHPITETEDFM